MGLIFFLRNFAYVFYVAMPKNLCAGFFCSVYMRETKWKPGFLKHLETRSFYIFLKIYWFIKNVSSHFFVGIALEKRESSKLQRKTTNCSTESEQSNNAGIWTYIKKLFQGVLIPLDARSWVISINDLQYLL